MILYVTFGGMIATTWVQIIKAGLLLTGADLHGVDRALAFRLQPGSAVRERVAVHPKNERDHGARAVWSTIRSRRSRSASR